MSDGHLNPRRVTVSFTEAPEVVKKLVSEFGEICGIKLNWKLNKHYNSLRARVYSKELCDLLLGFCNTIRKRPCDRKPACKDSQSCRICERNGEYPNIQIPSQICKDKKLASIFLRYFVTCDGGPEFSVYRNKKGRLQISYGVKFACNNPIIKSKLRQMLELLEIKPNDKRNGLILRSYYTIEKFQNQIGFLEESEMRRGKLFKGLPKNKIVELILNCRDLTAKGYWISKLENEENVKSYILGLSSSL